MNNSRRATEGMYDATQFRCARPSAIRSCGVRRGMMSAALRYLGGHGDGSGVMRTEQVRVREAEGQLAARRRREARHHRRGCESKLLLGGVLDASEPWLRCHPAIWMHQPERRLEP